MFYRITIANHTVVFTTHFSETIGHFRESVEELKTYNGQFVSVPFKLIEKDMNEYGNSSHYSEYMLLMTFISNWLIPLGCVFYHAVAVMISGNAYLITAKSGVGKSTQYKNLKELYGDEIQIINGDKPVLEFLNDLVIIHTSPWRGKEYFGSDLSAELKGIIFLKQDNENSMYKVAPENAVLLSLQQFFYLAESEELIRKICEYDRRLLQGVPVWMLKNKGDLESSRLLYRTVNAEKDGKG